ncbi:MAG TPA: dihydrofolate reductase family protein [Rhodothermales bacterium]|nr:dihydrofolate reductase family protein [Rhodothermales bacterium]
MRKIITSEWITLDGVFDSDPKYFEQWFAPYHSDARAAYIQKSILGCGTLLMGRTTYSALAPYWSAMEHNEMGVADKMNAVPKYVVSTTLQSADWNNTKKIISNHVAEEIAQLKQTSGDYILIPGSAMLIESLMEMNLIDEYRFLVHPIIMGSGKRFFKDGMPTTGLKLVKTEALDLGVMLHCYRRAGGS